MATNVNTSIVGPYSSVGASYERRGGRERRREERGGREGGGREGGEEGGREGGEGEGEREEREGGRERREGGRGGGKDSMIILYGTTLMQYLRCSYFNVGKKRMDQPVEKVTTAT